MVTTNDPDLWNSMWSFKDHGKNYDTVYHKQHPAGFRWLHESFGTNWRMIEMQAVIGRIQLTRMADWQQQRTDNATKIMDACAAFACLRVPRPAADQLHAYYRAYVFVRPDQLAQGWSRDRIMHEINALGVPCYSGSCSEVYLEKAFDDTGWRPAQSLPHAKQLGETSLMFLVHPTLQADEIAQTIAAIEQVMTQAQGVGS